MLRFLSGKFMGREGGKKNIEYVDLDEDLYINREKNLYVCGYELVRRRGSGKDDEVDPDIMRSFIDTVRNKLPRSSSFYIVTLVRRYYGGTYIICVDKNDKIQSVCELLATSLETLSRGLIKTKKLKKRDIEEIISLRSIQNGELPETHTLFADTIDVREINYSLKDFSDEDGLYLGETSKTRIKSRYMIPIKDLVRHIAIFGSTGSGKTTTAATIAYRAFLRGFRVYVLDWHGEYKEIIRSSHLREIEINYLSSLEKLEIFKEPNLVSEIFETVFDLTPAQSYVLSKVLMRLRGREFSFRRLYDEISMFPEDARWVPETKLSLMRKIEQLIDHEEANNDSDLEKIFAESSKEIISINLSGLDRTSMRSLASLLILKTIALNNNRGRESSYRTLIVVDEAHHIFKRSEGSSVARDALAEIRKYNIGLVMVTQSPSYVGDDILKNTNTKIIHSIRSEADRKILRDALYLPRELDESIPLLEVGEAVVASASKPYPVIVKISPPFTDSFISPND
ncbi:MAG: ATP-binding protein [Sulfolobales archaeon]